MQLSPQDVVVSLKLALQPGLTFQKLADALGLSVSAVHRSVTRAKAAGLLLADRQPNLQPFGEGGPVSGIWPRSI
ncbi:MAG: winged helix-turn-helix domain-containing protein [Planctomycetia bacterium]